MKASVEAKVSPVDLLSAQNLGCGVPTLLYVAIATPDAWGAWLVMDWMGFDGFCFVSLTLGVFILAALLQVMAIRELGPG